MEDHPVPHNILDIDFKLFGSFSPRQFIKLLGGAAVALGIYSLQLHPLIAYPVIVLALGYGIGSALIPKFNSSATTILSAVLVSPRYVWKKTPVEPEFLTKKYAAKMAATEKIASARSKNKINVNSVDLEELIELRSERRKGRQSQTKQDKQQDAEDDYQELFYNSKASSAFEDLYSNEFKKDMKQRQEEKVKISPGVDARIRRVIAEARPFTQPQPAQDQQIDIKELTTRIEVLQGQLKKLQKNQAEPEQIEEVSAEIDRLYKQMNDYKTKLGQDSDQDLDKTHIYGIVVTQQDTPVAEAKVTIKNVKGKSLITMQTSQDGRFHSEKSFEPAEYKAQIEAKGLKFDEYTIVVEKGRLPAYRFHAR